MLGRGGFSSTVKSRDRLLGDELSNPTTRRDVKLT